MMMKFASETTKPFVDDYLLSVELQLDLRILYLSIIHQYTNFRPNYRSEGGAMMDLKAVGQRIKAAREAKNLTQEELAALVNLSTTHVSVIERGLKVTKLDTFVAIANALDVSADALLIDVVTHSVTGVTNELSDMIEKLPKDEGSCANFSRSLVSVL